MLVAVGRRKGLVELDPVSVQPVNHDLLCALGPERLVMMGEGLGGSGLCKESRAGDGVPVHARASALVVAAFAVAIEQRKKDRSFVRLQIYACRPDSGRRVLQRGRCRDEQRRGLTSWIDQILNVTAEPGNGEREVLADP